MGPVRPVTGQADTEAASYLLLKTIVMMGVVGCGFVRFSCADGLWCQQTRAVTAVTKISHTGTTLNSCRETWSSIWYFRIDCIKRGQNILWPFLFGLRAYRIRNPQRNANNERRKPFHVEGGHRRTAVTKAALGSDILHVNCPNQEEFGVNVSGPD